MESRQSSENTRGEEIDFSSTEYEPRLYSLQSDSSAVSPSSDSAARGNDEQESLVSSLDEEAAFSLGYEADTGFASNFHQTLGLMNSSADKFIPELEINLLDEAQLQENQLQEKQNTRQSLNESEISDNKLDNAPFLGAALTGLLLTGIIADEQSPDEKNQSEEKKSQNSEIESKDNKGSPQEANSAEPLSEFLKKSGSEAHPEPPAESAKADFQLNDLPHEVGRIETADQEAIRPFKELMRTTVSDIQQGRYREAYQRLLSTDTHGGKLRIGTFEVPLELSKLDPDKYDAASRESYMAEHLKRIGSMASANESVEAVPGKPREYYIGAPVSVLRLESGAEVNLMQPDKTTKGAELSQGDKAEIERFRQSPMGKFLAERHVIMLAEEVSHINQIARDHKALTSEFSNFTEQRGNVIMVPEFFPAEDYIKHVNAEREIPFIMEEAGMPQEMIKEHYGHQEQRAIVFEYMEAAQSPKPAPQHQEQGSSTERPSPRGESPLKVEPPALEPERPVRAARERPAEPGMARVVKADGTSSISVLDPTHPISRLAWNERLTDSELKEVIEARKTYEERLSRGEKLNSIEQRQYDTLRYIDENKYDTRMHKDIIRSLEQMEAKNGIKRPEGGFKPGETLSRLTGLSILLTAAFSIYLTSQNESGERPSPRARFK